MLPKYRTFDYAIMKACERFNILPPSTKASWDDCNIEAKARLIAFNQIRDYEDLEERENFYKVLGAR